MSDRYAGLERLADLFDRAGTEVRARADLGALVLGDPSYAGTAELAPATWRRVEQDVRAATEGPHGLAGRSLELDADAVVLRATARTGRWVDELVRSSYDVLPAGAAPRHGDAPAIALGGAIVAAGLIETDPLDRTEVVTFLGELAESNPELMDHVTRGGGGLLDSLRMRSALTSAVLARRADSLGGGPFDPGFGPALRDVAGHPPAPRDPHPDPGGAIPAERRPASVADLMRRLAREPRPVAVERLGPGRYVGYLTGPTGAAGRVRHLVGSDHAPYAAQVVRDLEHAVAGSEEHPHVLLVGRGQGGMCATEIAVAAPSAAFTVDQVVTAGAPSAQLPAIPDGTHLLSIEDRADPVVLLGSLLTAGAANRVTVLLDSTESGTESDLEDPLVAGGTAVDRSDHPDLRAVLARLRNLGYLAT